MPHPSFRDDPYTRQCFPSTVILLNALGKRVEDLDHLFERQRVRPRLRFCGTFNCRHRIVGTLAIEVLVEL